MSKVTRYHLHPGVDALGYVKRIIPDLLSSISFFNVTFLPSFVSTSPPKPSTVIVSPAATLSAIAAEPFVDGSPLFLEVDDLTELAFFTGGDVVSAGGALRLRSSTILDSRMSVECNQCSRFQRLWWAIERILLDEERLNNWAG